MTNETDTWGTNGNAGPKRSARYSVEDGVKKRRGRTQPQPVSRDASLFERRQLEARFIVDPGLVPVLPRVVEGGRPPIERGILLCPRPTVQVEDMVVRCDVRCDKGLAPVSRSDACTLAGEIRIFALHTHTHTHTHTLHMMFTGPGCCNGTAESSTPLQHSTFVHRRLLSASTRYYHRLRKRPFLALLCAAASARLSTLVCQLLSIPAKNMLRSSPRSVAVVGGSTFGKLNSPEWSRMYRS